MLKKIIVITLGSVGVLSFAWGSPKAKSVQNQVVPLGEKLQLSYNPNQWLYYQPDFLRSSGVSVLESSKTSSIHGFVRNEVSAQGAQIGDLCKQLADIPLKEGAEKGKFSLEKIGHVDVCRVTKSEPDQSAIQYVLLSESPRKNGPSVHFTHYIYFYFPQSANSVAATQIAGLVRGIESVKK